MVQSEQRRRRVLHRVLLWSHEWPRRRGQANCISYLDRLLESAEACFDSRGCGHESFVICCCCYGGYVVFWWFVWQQPKQVRDIKAFLMTCRQSGAESVLIKHNKNNCKFKVRCRRYLHTLVVQDKEKAEKLKQSLPPGLSMKEVSWTEFYRPSLVYLIYMSSYLALFHWVGSGGGVLPCSILWQNTLWAEH